jgi:DNA ligase-1
MITEKDMMRGTDWFGQVNPLGWWASEKFNGVRAYWDGAALWTRSGHEIISPLTADLPRGVHLDGELWAGYGKFSQVSKLVRHGGDWTGTQYIVFDAPQAEGTWRQRLVAAEVTRVTCVEAWEITTLEKFSELYQSILIRGGEGLVLRSVTERGYRPGLSNNFLKVKGGVLDYVRHNANT